MLDCTDKIDTRKLINAATYRASTPLFIAAASGLSWQALNLPQNSTGGGCYACLVEYINVREDCLSKGVLGPVVGMAACHQATQALLFLAKGFSANIKWGHYLTGKADLGSLKSFTLPPLLLARYVMTQIKVNVNNQPMNVISPISLSELVALKQINVDGTAIAKNAAIVSKRDWSTTYLNDNDTVDIFTLVAGG